MDPAPDFGYDTYKGCGRLKGKKALVTGADSGIGRAVALAYAREGADVAISYLSEHDDAEVTKKVVEEAGQQALLLPGDLADDEHLKKVVAETASKFGRIDILGEAVEDFTQLSRERLEHTFNVNIIGMIRLAQEVVEHMPAGGSIINTASIQAAKPNPTILDYACTKGAIVTMTKCLAKQLIGSRGIRVNAVAPGPVWTPLIAESFPAEKVETFGRGQTPTDRAGQPAELAPPFVFLANTAEASYVNGEIMNVTGGMEMG
ncbi:g9903 [Coccomyxa viridis]|uniref:G9903 protein n=1 Tax=Coccomyxa viridis TaxID=1274662 RepID=A0ABP1G6R3_9CHLO